VPMQAHYLPLRGLEKLLQTVHLVSQSLNPSIRVTGILLCMHDGSSSHARAVISEIEQQLGQFRAAEVPWSAARVLHPPVRRNIKLAEAPSFGQTIFDYAPRCPGAGDYREIVRSLLERWGLPHGEFESGVRRRRTGGGAEAAGRTPRREPRRKPASKTKTKTKRPRARGGGKGRRAAAKRGEGSARSTSTKRSAPAKPGARKKSARAGVRKVGKPPKPSRRPKRAARGTGRDMRSRRAGTIRSGGLSL
jgi:hypothetical protein